MRGVALSCGLIGLGWILHGCAGRAPTDCDSRSTCLDGVGADAGIDGPWCDPSKGPKDAPCIVDDAFGVFVSPMGSEGAPGTKGAPMRRISEALAKAKEAKQRVFVCQGRYDEALVVDASVDGVRVYGGLSCDTWAWGAENQVTVAPLTEGPALRVAQLTKGTVIEDVTFVAMPATTAGGSSIAALISESHDVVLRRTVLEAGTGQPGADGASIADFAPARAPQGGQGTTSGGGQQLSVTCSNGSGTTVGGAGGQPSVGGAHGSPGTPFVEPVAPPGFDGLGGAAGGSCTTGIGHDGSYGAAGAGGEGARSHGTLSAAGGMPSSGSPGGTGTVGQGGGGGASRDGTGGGGGGGPGGCGGIGGEPGQGGGASIALAMYRSSVHLKAAVLVAKDGGAGGAGGGGQKAQLGGIGGVQSSSACPGGSGGHGGSGGGGGGGAGGISVGILWSDAPPELDDHEVKDADSYPGITLGTPGAGGASGPGGAPAQSGAPASYAGIAGGTGIDGVAKAILGS